MLLSWQSLWNEELILPHHFYVDGLISQKDDIIHYWQKVQTLHNQNTQLKWASIANK